MGKDRITRLLQEAVRAGRIVCRHGIRPDVMGIPRKVPVYAVQK